MNGVTMSRRRPLLFASLAALLFVGPVPAVSAPTTLVSAGSSWRYLDTGVDPGAGWTAAAFDDASWAQGPAQLGYGDGDEATVVSYGGDASNKHTTTWFRSSFNVAAASAFSSLDLSVIRDDGVVVHLNGTEVYRSNIGTGPVGPNTFATSAIGGSAESTWQQATLSPSLLVDGRTRWRSRSTRPTSAARTSASTWS